MLNEQRKEVSPNFTRANSIIKWFYELNKESVNIAGGKGANLAEIYNLGISVPEGFVITAQAYDYFIKNSGAEKKIKELLNNINYENTEELNKITKKIRETIEDSEFPEEIKENIIEAYEILSIDLSKSTNSAATKEKIAEVLIKNPEPIFVAIRSSATTEDLTEASFAGQQETFLNVKGNQELLEKIKKCFASLFTSRATYYRKRKGFKHEEARLAVVVQRMINSEKSGVIFSKDPATGEDHVVIEAVFGLGEGIVSGKITPDKYIVSGKSYENFKILEEKINEKKIEIVKGERGEEKIVKLSKEKSGKKVLTDKEIRELTAIALRLEKHYQKPQDIEFAIEGGEIYIVQTRPITTLEKVSEKDLVKELKGQIIIEGIAASPGIGVGKVKVIERLEDLKKIQKGDVLVTKMTNPDMVVTMQRCSAIVTDEGGLTAHAAIISREMGIPAIVGTQEATKKLKENEIITVNGFTGKIYRGRVSESIEKEIKPIPSNARNTKIKLKVIIDLPSFAKRAAKSDIKAVGLARLEGIIAESGKHPLYFLTQEKIKDYEEIIYKGIKEISEHFEEIWVRTSDIRSDEFQNLAGSPREKEANPMLGMHGIRFSLKYPEILKAELRAIKRVANEVGTLGKKIGVMAPQIISLEELKKLKKIISEVGFSNVKVGIMVETPASVEIIQELCQEGIDFVSFGTNDLTQYTLAVDRGNKQVQELYNELHPAVLSQISRVIKICKKYKVESSICGQAGSKREMVKFLVKEGIDSISVNADAAAEIAVYISEIEKEIASSEAIKEIEGLAVDKILEKDQKLIEDRVKYIAREIKKESEDFPVIRGAEWLLGETLQNISEATKKESKESEGNEVLDIF